MNLKAIFIATAIGLATWAAAISLYAIYAAWVISNDQVPVGTMDYKNAMVNCYNIALPGAVGCLLLLYRIRITNSVAAETFLFTGMIILAASVLVYKATPDAFGAHPREYLAETVWWIPAPDSNP